MLLFFEGLQPQNVLFLFLFSMKNTYLLTDVEYLDTTLKELVEIYVPWWYIRFIRLPLTLLKPFLWN